MHENTYSGFIHNCRKLETTEISPEYSVDWCWSLNANTLATWCLELTHLKRPWCWERLKAGGEGDDRGWDGWMASPTQWTWVWVNSWSCLWTGRPGVLQPMGSQRVGHYWASELNWTEKEPKCSWAGKKNIHIMKDYSALRMDREPLLSVTGRNLKCIMLG